MDYAFVPGATDYELSMRRLLSNRPQTQVTSTGVYNVSGFLQHLNTNLAVTKPINTILISSHASNQGWLIIDLDTEIKGDIDYEKLQQVHASGSIQIPSALINPRPDDGMGNPSPAFVHIKGCRIGQAIPFLQMLQTALGGGVSITAPKHFHGVHDLPGLGSLEYMAYSFQINRKTPFANRQEAIDAFKAGSFTLIDGSAVPDAHWEQYIPQDIGSTKTIIMHQVNLGQPIKNLSAIPNIEGQFRHLPVSVGTFDSDVGNPPATEEAERMAKLRLVFVEDPNNSWDDSHPFPKHQRYGYTTLDEFIDGVKWQFKVEKDVLFGTGFRHEYICVVPITDPTNNQLYFNFYPDSASGLATIKLLEESDTQFFATI